MQSGKPSEPSENFLYSSLTGFNTLSSSSHTFLLTTGHEFLFSWLLSWAFSSSFFRAILKMLSSSKQYSLLTSDVGEGDLFRSHTSRGRWRERYATSLVSQIALVILVGSLGFILGVVVSLERNLPSEIVDAVYRGNSP